MAMGSAVGHGGPRPPGARIRRGGAAAALAALSFSKLLCFSELKGLEAEAALTYPYPQTSTTTTRIRSNPLLAHLPGRRSLHCFTASHASH